MTLRGEGGFRGGQTRAFVLWHKAGGAATTHGTGRRGNDLRPDGTGCVVQGLCNLSGEIAVFGSGWHWIIERSPVGLRRVEADDVFGRCWGRGDVTGGAKLSRLDNHGDPLPWSPERSGD